MRSVSWIEQRMASMSQVWASFFERRGAAMEGRHGHEAARAESADPCPHGQPGSAGAQHGQPSGAGAGSAYGAGASNGSTGAGAGGACPGVQPGGLYMLDDSWDEIRDDGAAPLCLNASQQGTGELDAALMRPSYAFAEDGWVRFEVLSDQQLIDHCQGEIAVLLRSFQGNPEERALLLMPLIRMLVRQCGPLPVELTRCAMDRADMLRRSLRLANTALEVYGTLSASLVKSSTVLKSLSAQAARQAKQGDADEDSEGGAEQTDMDGSVRDSSASDSASTGRARSRGRAPAAQPGAAAASPAGAAAGSSADGADGADEIIEDSRNWRFFAVGSRPEGVGESCRVFKGYQCSQPGLICGDSTELAMYNSSWCSALMLDNDEYEGIIHESDWESRWDCAGYELNDLHHELNDFISVLHNSDLPGQISADLLARQAAGLDFYEHNASGSTWLASPAAHVAAKGRAGTGAAAGSKASGSKAGGSRHESTHKWLELTGKEACNLARTLWGTGTGNCYPQVTASAWGKVLSSMGATALYDSELQAGAQPDVNHSAGAMPAASYGSSACAGGAWGSGAWGSSAFAGMGQGQGIFMLPELERVGKKGRPFCGDSLDMRRLATSRVLGPMVGLAASDDEWARWHEEALNRCRSNIMVRTAGFSELSVNRDHNSDGVLNAFKKEHFGPLCQSLYHQAVQASLGRYDHEQLQVIVQLSLIMICIAHQLWRIPYEYEICADNGQRYDAASGTVSLSQFCENTGAHMLYVRYRAQCERLNPWTATFHDSLSDYQYHDRIERYGVEVFRHFCSHTTAVISQIFPYQELRLADHVVPTLVSGLCDFLEAVEQPVWEPVHAQYIIQYLTREQLACGLMLRTQIKHDLSRLHALGMACNIDLNAPPSRAADVWQRAMAVAKTPHDSVTDAKEHGMNAAADTAVSASAAAADTEGAASAADGAIGLSSGLMGQDNSTADAQVPGSVVAPDTSMSADPDDPEAAFDMEDDEFELVIPSSAIQAVQGSGAQAGSKDAVSLADTDMIMDFDPDAPFDPEDMEGSYLDMGADDFSGIDDLAAADLSCLNSGDDDTAPADNTALADDTTPADYTAPADDTAPADESAVAEAGAAAGSAEADNDAQGGDNTDAGADSDADYDGYSASDTAVSVGESTITDEWDFIDPEALLDAQNASTAVDSSETSKCNTEDKTENKVSDSDSEPGLCGAYDASSSGEEEAQNKTAKIAADSANDDIHAICSGNDHDAQAQHPEASDSRLCSCDDSGDSQSGSKYENDDSCRTVCKTDNEVYKNDRDLRSSEADKITVKAGADQRQNGAAKIAVDAHKADSEAICGGKNQPGSAAVNTCTAGDDKAQSGSADSADNALQINIDSTAADSSRHDKTSSSHCDYTFLQYADDSMVEYCEVLDMETQLLCGMRAAPADAEKALVAAHAADAADTVDAAGAADTVDADDTVDAAGASAAAVNSCAHNDRDGELSESCSHDGRDSLPAAADKAAKNGASDNTQNNLQSINSDDTDCADADCTDSDCTNGNKVNNKVSISAGANNDSQYSEQENLQESEQNNLQNNLEDGLHLKQSNDRQNDLQNDQKDDAHNDQKDDAHNDLHNVSQDNGQRDLKAVSTDSSCSESCAVGADAAAAGGAEETELKELPELTDELRLELQLREMKELFESALRRVSINRSDSDVYVSGNYVFFLDRTRAWAVLNSSWQEYIYGPFSRQSESNSNALGMEILQSFIAAPPLSETSTVIQPYPVLIRTATDVIIARGYYLCFREMDLGAQVLMQEYNQEEDHAFLDWQLRVAVSLYLLACSRAGRGQDPLRVDLGEKALMTALSTPTGFKGAALSPASAEAATAAAGCAGGCALDGIASGSGASRSVTSRSGACRSSASEGVECRSSALTDGAGAYSDPGYYYTSGIGDNCDVFNAGEFFGSGEDRFYDSLDAGELDDIEDDYGLVFDSDGTLVTYSNDEVITEQCDRSEADNSWLMRCLSGRGFDWRRVSLHGFGPEGPRVRVRASTSVESILSGSAVIREIFGRVVIKNSSHLNFRPGEDLSGVDIEIHALNIDPLFTSFSAERRRTREILGRNAIADSAAQARKALNLSSAVEKEGQKALREACSDDFLRNSLEDMITPEQMELNAKKPRTRKSKAEKAASESSSAPATARRGRKSAATTAAQAAAGAGAVGASAGSEVISDDAAPVKARRGRKPNGASAASAASADKAALSACADGDSAVSDAGSDVPVKARRGRRKKSESADAPALSDAATGAGAATGVCADTGCGIAGDDDTGAAVIGAAVSDDNNADASGKSTVKRTRGRKKKADSTADAQEAGSTPADRGRGRQKGSTTAVVSGTSTGNSRGTSTGNSRGTYTGTCKMASGSGAKSKAKAGDCGQAVRSGGRRKLKDEALVKADAIEERAKARDELEQSDPEYARVRQHRSALTRPDVSPDELAAAIADPSLCPDFEITSADEYDDCV